ncbi:MAG TPA: enoyl-CoA hydratase-related protein [Kouleothrix sp.]|uniref:enoyl-CoA hydratase-related protein n=1 Tax=Kouleothrix sp. TaxID=2779161 RepID=UPI002BB177E2|nr:enoyl-CoA hydratase-related protein [Kouleothrix sp.]HRC76966.1 enoyl-CoA hydratase-related protein [Kouleothrix sp.]
MVYTSIDLSIAAPLATLTLNRPDLHNAFDAAMIAELRSAFAALAADASVRVVILAGAGPSFCAGGDARWMRASLGWSHAENVADAQALDALFDAAWSLPKPLIGRVHGAALGGGAGLVACCDLVVAEDSARFGFTEVKLGLLPAVIAQYVVPKIGLGHARALFVSGERFTAERAFEIGLVHAITSAGDLDATVRSLAARMLTSAPGAIAAAKRVLDVVSSRDREAARAYVVEAIAAARTGPEGQEGLRAFLEKRRPSWAPVLER